MTNEKIQRIKKNSNIEIERMYSCLSEIVHGEFTWEY